MPNHTHAVSLAASSPTARGTNSATHVGSYVAEGGIYTTVKNTTMTPDPVALTPTGGPQAHQNRSPFLAVNYCIALQGFFPPRS